MLMLYYKSRVAEQTGAFDGVYLLGDCGRLAGELQQGLRRLILAVGNFSAAFEALDGMRGRYMYIAYISVKAFVFELMITMRSH